MDREGVMAVDTPASERTIHLSAYVERSIDELVRAFAGEDADSLLGSAAQESVTLHAAPPQPVSNGTARIVVEWAAVGSSGTRTAGSGTISLLVVQSGRHPMTELLVSMAVPEAVASTVAPVVRHFLDELAARLSRAAP